MLTGHCLPHWFRFRNVPVQVVVTLLGILCWVGETEIKGKLQIHTIGICEALALEWEMMTGRA